MTETRPAPDSADAPEPGAALPYTQRTHDALVAAQAVSRPSEHQMGPTVGDRHAAINAAHLMLGILAETGSTATRAFTEQGVPLGRARMRMAELTLLPAGREQRQSGEARPGGPPLPAIDVVMEGARAEALRRARPAVGTGHLLLSLAAPEALRADLEDLGLDVPAATRFVVSSYDDEPPRPREARESA